VEVVLVDLNLFLECNGGLLELPIPTVLATTGSRGAVLGLGLELRLGLGLGLV